ncbi:cystathionine beta-lyase [Afifella sp. IM 167]|uniref:cystathionine beta-lyase n=1 Tax=Afifella sp. IM 167 TaxID=2033586 RepID=UPI001CCA5318|nr:cystathionine beta-lyase [Afifella sp. IM 167]MBZ8132443.1 cystathionine beta-lyase [Afifella sp. IM 167]
MNSDEGPGRNLSASGRRPATLLTHAGRDPHSFHGFVNPPVVRASTVLFASADEMKNRRTSRYSYGLTNTPTIEALNGAWTELEGAATTVLVPSGLAAVTVAILASVSAGEEILVPDNVYGPTRAFCNGTLKRLGIGTTFYDPMDLASLKEALKNGARAVFAEAPGSLTFEFPDLQEILDAAAAADAVTMIDNTWATPLIYRPIEHGFDLSIQASTKYVGGHADLMLGSISASEKMATRLMRTHRELGVQAGPDEIYLGLRGMRTMKVRLEQHERQALEVAKWVGERAQVKRLLHPAFPSCPGHENWRRFFGRSCGLFAFELDGDGAMAERFLDSLKLFGLGFSWGGFESLASYGELTEQRTVKPWTGGPVVRLHIGLEDIADQIADLEGAFAALAE